MVPQSSDRNLTPLESTVGELLAAADLVMERGYAMPGLILLYSLVDTMAWLSLPEGVEDVRGTDFISWVRTYGLEQRVAPCTADELYGARCGLLHSFSPDSRRSRRGEIRPIYYVWGGAGDRKSGVEGKRGDLGGRRIIKKKKKEERCGSDRYEAARRSTLTNSRRHDTSHTECSRSLYRTAAPGDTTILVQHSKRRLPTGAS